VRAVGIREFGGREKLEVLDVPEPKLAPDQVLIRIRAAGVNPVDWKIREGRNEPRFPHIFPVVLGWDAAGVVERVGPSVTEFAAGDEVFTYCRKHFVGDGTYTELISVPATFVARKPRALDFERAAAVPLAALTAYQALFRAAGVTAGESVLIQGAAGGVGSFAVQIAKAFGGVVTGVCSTAKADLVRALGADHVIDYNREDSPTASTATTSSSTSAATAGCPTSGAPSPPREHSSSSEARPRVGGWAAPTDNSGRSCCPSSSARNWAPSSHRRTPPT
jgi:NADPH:quinone reductase-like Zn-dependent oxidoreductase